MTEYMPSTSQGGVVHAPAIAIIGDLSTPSSLWSPLHSTGFCGILTHAQTLEFCHTCHGSPSHCPISNNSLCQSPQDPTMPSVTRDYFETLWRPPELFLP